MYRYIISLHYCVPLASLNLLALKPATVPGMLWHGPIIAIVQGGGKQTAIEKVARNGSKGSVQVHREQAFSCSPCDCFIDGAWVELTLPRRYTT